MALRNDQDIRAVSSSIKLPMLSPIINAVQHLTKLIDGSTHFCSCVLYVCVHVCAVVEIESHYTA